MTEAEFFAGHLDARIIHGAVARAMGQLGAFETRVSKGQIGFYRARPFSATYLTRWVASP